MVEPTIDQRLAAIEARLAALEGVEPSPSPELASHLPATPPVVGFPSPPPVTVARRFEISASMVLGWAGAAALLLAAAYFVRLAIAEGWITPWIQVAGAALAGAVMIVGAFTLRGRDRLYSSLLGAGGIATLYVAVYGAHVHHGLIGSLPAVVAAAGVAALSLAMHARFREPVYVAFALGGSYLTPFLLPRPAGSIHELALYLGIWNAAYAAYAVRQRSRAVYLAAVYAFLVVFAWGWDREPVPAPWGFASAFLLLQAGLFVAAALLVSVRARRPLPPSAAWAHLPALLFFYVLQGEVLAGQLRVLGPWTIDLAPWAGIALALIAYAGWGVGRAALAETARASLEVVHAFAAIVFVHAVYFDLVSPEWRPLVAVAFAAAVAFGGVAPLRARPWLATGVFLFAAGYVQVAVAQAIDEPVVARSGMWLAYPALVYALYFARGTGKAAEPGPAAAGRWLLLAFAHAMALGAAVQLVSEWLGSPDTTVERLWLSLAWAGIGLAWLLLGTARGDATLARSTLGIFAAFTIKVVFVDLDQAGPLVRVGILVVLGLTLYAGGWIYRRVLDPVSGTRS